MKAIVCEGFGPLETLSYKDVDNPVVKDHTVLIRPEAIGVNYPDGLLVQGLYQMKPATPFVPGMEVAGTVEEVGSEVNRFKPGDRVAALCQIGGVFRAGRRPATGGLSSAAGHRCGGCMCAHVRLWHLAPCAQAARSTQARRNHCRARGRRVQRGLPRYQIAKIMGARRHCRGFVR